MVRRNVENLYAPSTRGGVELLLAENVKGLGQQGDVVKVKPGYARNFLLPQGLATVATEENKQAVIEHRKRQEEVQKKRHKSLQELAQKVKDYSVTLEANANQEGHLYGSILAPEISAALVKAGYEIEEDHIKLDGPIKETGMFNVKLQLHENIESIVKVWVIPSSNK